MAVALSPSFQSALCVVPDLGSVQGLNRLRALYDPAYEKWPAHINLIYPFVERESLETALQRIRDGLQSRTRPGKLKLVFDAAGSFSHGNSASTVYLTAEAETCLSGLTRLLRDILALAGPREHGQYIPHLTLGKSYGIKSSAHALLLEKAKFLLPVVISTSKLVILARDLAIELGSNATPGRMTPWGVIDLTTFEVEQVHGAMWHPPLYWSPSVPQDFPSFKFAASSQSWVAVETPTGSHEQAADSQANIVVSSYNVLAGSEHPPSRARYGSLVATILRENALADILALQEVTDDFLSFLLRQDKVRLRYNFSTHAPPEQQGSEPLPGFLNVVILSRHPFSWRLLPLSRPFKASPVATFMTIRGSASLQPLVVAACHLTKGLTDGAVAAKRNEVQTILAYAKQHHDDHPFVLLGDFNLPTSSISICSAREKRAISNYSVGSLDAISKALSVAGLEDAWLSTRLAAGESSSIFPSTSNSALYSGEGEQGATFDPLANTLAQESVGDPSSRPQRYDRILLRGNDFRARAFNLFGYANSPAGQMTGWETPASDHWGVRCLLTRANGHPASREAQHVVSIVRGPVPEDLANGATIAGQLKASGQWPTQEDQDNRDRIVESLRSILTRSTGLRLVLAPVGSFGLGTWTSSSDIDCLCLGTVSEATFFSIARKQLSAAASAGVTSLRRVRARTGIMLQLEIRKVRVELHYCPSAALTESWPDVLKRPVNDPAFSLSPRVLLKLKPARDLAYIWRSIPDLTVFLSSFLIIKAWAKERGLYAGRFGYLSGINIAVMLTCVCKMTASHGSAPAAGVVVATFFHHYAALDWARDIVFDPFFHCPLRYRRAPREAMCILGWHSPSLNTALTASRPTVKVLAQEISRTSELLHQASSTWTDICSAAASSDGTMTHPGSSDFLSSYPTYIRIDINYWGPSRNKRTSFLGWLESRFAMLLVEIDKDLPDVGVRFWPAKFTPGQEESLDFHTCYLMGLECTASSGGRCSESNTALTPTTLLGALARFERQIRGDSKYYNPLVCWMGANVVEASSVAGLQLDDRDGGAGALEADNFASSEDESDFPDESDREEDAEGATARHVPVEPDEWGPGRRGKVESSGRLGPGSVEKLRPASEVLSRIRHDGSYDTSDFLVGYQDRFVGAKEKGVDDWKDSDTTEEEFIPQHRILYFKRRSDGEIVWDRHSKKDLVFRSGRSAVMNSAADKVRRPAESDGD